MQIDTALMGALGDVPARARMLAEAGFDGVFTFEGNADIFFPLVLAAEHTDLAIATNVAIAFPRSPMHLAYQAWDLQRQSQGRFSLGLGTQIRPHIERRFSAVWGKPVAHMRELVEAIRAIFACWQDGLPLDHHGDYYELDLMTPVFVPEALPGGPPPIWLGALGPRMTNMAGQVADGLWIHPFNTRTVLVQHTLPNLTAGAESVGRQVADVSLGVDVMIGVYRDDAERETAVNGCRFNLAFYGSTPAYRITLDTHGWGDLQPRLRTLTKENRWEELGTVIDDEILHAIAVVGTPEECARQLRDRYGDLATRLGFSLPYGAEPDLLAELVAACRVAMP
ncbi:MAG: TIGR03617 family F420-dependent LLM class oxidoreductase [Acidimicrobiia bacterium]|nr:TIGR03617 family F420-dependent LLM class oxidoreductase [Acidimicrobiia bacterium]